MGEGTLRLRVRAVREEAVGIRRYWLVEASGGPLPAFEPGAHLELSIPGGFSRCYSLCGEPGEAYEIAVQREERGRGGSRAMHDAVRVDDVLESSPPRNQFRLIAAPRVVLIAGGIGITPVLPMARALARAGTPFTLYYCTRSPERTAFRKELTVGPLAAQVVLHHDGGDPARALDLRAVLAVRPAGAHLYCCGPGALMEAVRTIAAASWPEEAVHFESFGASSGTVLGEPFEAVVRSTGQVVQVGARETLLSALRAKNVVVPSSCEAGTCGTCSVGLLEGEADHRDKCLTQPERVGQISMCPCVSRAKRGPVVLDL